MECFYIDESGYTGADLFNSEQRFQGASAVSIGNDEAAKLIQALFPNLQAPELKYHALVRRPSYREPLMCLMRAVLSEYKCVTYVCDKRFLLILMFLDYAAEPFYYNRGENFYKDGQNFSLASLLYKTGPSLLGETAFNLMLSSFQKAVKVKTPEALNELVDATKKLNWRELPEALGPIACKSPECMSAIATLGVTTDAAMVVLQALISRLELMAEGSYRIEHDQSKNLLKYHQFLKRFSDHQEKIEFVQSRLARIRFPLKLASVVQVDSKSIPGVQIADVLVGAAVEAANVMAGLRSPQLDPEEVLSLYSDDQLIHLLPSTDFEQQNEFRKGTQAAELIDYFTRHFNT